PAPCRRCRPGRRRPPPAGRPADRGGPAGQQLDDPLGRPRGLVAVGADVAPLGRGRCEGGDRLGGVEVGDDDVGLGQQPGGPPGEQQRVARAGADEVDDPGAAHRSSPGRPPEVTRPSSWRSGPSDPAPPSVPSAARRPPASSPPAAAATARGEAAAPTTTTPAPRLRSSASSPSGPRRTGPATPPRVVTTAAGSEGSPLRARRAATRPASSAVSATVTIVWPGSTARGSRL